ncbi:Macrophage colony-stimulating factor 1 receptor, partial [Orchesella cincta]
SSSTFDSSDKDFTINLNTIENSNDVRFVDKYSSMFQVPPVAEIFLTKGDTEDTIPLNATNTGEIVIDEKMLHNGTQYNHVVLACNSSYPVEWVYENGDGAPRLYTTQIRTFGDFHDPSTYGHSSIVVLFQERFNEQQTGSYFCQSIHKPELRVGFHLYFTGEFGFPSMDNRIVEAEDSNSAAILPCPTTDPAANIELHKIGPSGEITNLTHSNLIHYDPTIGFILRPSDFPEPYGSYKCRTNGRDSGWKVDLLEPKIDVVRVYPHTEVVHMEDFSNHTFMCKAKESIAFNFPNTINFGTVHYLENPVDMFPFIAVLRISPHVPLYSISNYFKINCITKKTRRVLHSWEYSSFGPEQISVSFEKEQKRLLCCSKSGLTPLHEVARCETDTDCSIKQHCFKTGRCDYAFPPKFIDAPKGCSAVDLSQDIPSHVMRCSVGKHSKSVYITSNVDNNDVIMYDRERNPPTDQILKIVSLGQEGNRVDIQCLGSLFFFSTNLLFAYEKKDGSLHLAEEASIQDVNSYGPILHMQVEADVVRVYCFAPLTRSAEWLNVSLPIITVPGTPTTTEATTIRPQTTITETRVSTSSSTSVRVMKISGRMRSRFSKKT